MTLRIARYVLVAVLVALPSAAVAGPAKPERPTLSAEQQSQVESGNVVVYATKGDPGSSVATATGIVEIRTTEGEIFDILCSEEHSEAASRAMQECTIREDTRIGPGHRRLTVTYRMRVVGQDIEWTVVRDLYEGDGLLTFEIDESCDNDIAWTAGQYSMYPGSTSDRIMIVYVSNLDTGRRIPNWVEEDLTQGSLKRYLKYLKTAAEAD